MADVGGEGGEREEGCDARQRRERVVNRCGGEGEFWARRRGFCCGVAGVGGAVALERGFGGGVEGGAGRHCGW